MRLNPSSVVLVMLAFVQAACWSTPHADHRPRYGGLVLMHGDLHFEVILKPSGRYQVYFSDAVRTEVPAAAASDVTITVNHAEGLVETLNARIDESGKSWAAQGRRVDNEIDSTARVAFTYRGENYWIDLPF